MKQLSTTLLLAIAIFSGKVQAQVSFNEDMDVLQYMEGKTFYNAELGMEIEYGVLPSFNTVGITVINKNGAVFYFINVDIKAYDAFADLQGMSPHDGTNFGFRLYKGKLIVGRGEPGEQTFYLR
ncbi:hypothetical protein LBMAG25_14160 [Bacteroidota bacterium]|nr:hypothetical protein LBMAG25_14160 [Bacteroidota bacterium]